MSADQLRAAALPPSAAARDAVVVHPFPSGMTATARQSSTSTIPAAAANLAPDDSVLAGLTLKQFRALSAVAATANFRQAANRIGVTQPSLSAQIQGLETTLGTRLVERSRTGARLTPVGRLIESDIRGILDATRRLASRASTAESVSAVHLGIANGIGAGLLRGAVRDLRESLPDLRVSLREATPTALVENLSSGAHDVIVTAARITAPDVATEELFREPLHVLIAADHPLARRDAVGVADLAGETILAVDPADSSLAGLAEVAGARLDRLPPGTSTEALRLMVALGAGVTFLPLSMVRGDVDGRDDVVARSLSDRALGRTVTLGWRRSAGRSAATNTLARVLADSYRRLRTSPA